MNSLPLRTLSTTPHLLHTRRILLLPPGKRVPPLPSVDPETTAARNRERAEKRFQFVTKEVDWRVAKAYVALSEEEFVEDKGKEDPKALNRQQRHHVLESAVNQYLEDDEWERRGGKEPRIHGFPLFSSSSVKQKYSSDS